MIGSIKVATSDNTPNGLTTHAMVEIYHAGGTISIHRGRKHEWDTFKLTLRNIERLSRFTPHAVWVTPFCVKMNIYPRINAATQPMPQREQAVEKALSRTGVYINDSYWVVQDGERILKLTINEFNALQRTGRIRRDMTTSTYDVMPF